MNKGYNAKILAACEPLNEYAAFIGRIRENEAEGMFFSDAVIESIDYCIMKAKGYPLSDICEITGLTVKKIEEL